MIIRRKHKARFTIVPNAIYEDAQLSLEAKGALGYLLSRPHDWTVRHDQLQSALKIGRKWLDRIIQELIAAGYIQRDPEQGRDEQNRFTTYNYVVTDEPVPTAARPVDQVPGARMAHRRRPLRDRDNGTKKEEKLKTQDTNLPLPLSVPEPVAKPRGFAKEERHSIFARDRGRIEVEIAKRLGSDGFAVLMALPSHQVDQLCAQQRRGTLDDVALQRARASVALSGQRHAD